MTVFRKTLLTCCTLALVGCGLFSSDKDLPKGERLSVLTTRERQATTSTALSPIKLPETYRNTAWTQIGGDATHQIGNLSAGSSKKLWKSNFGKGATKRNLLMTSPVVSGELVYTQDTTGTVTAFRLSNGEKVWKSKIKPLLKNESENGANGSGIATNGQFVLATTGSGSLVAFDALSGLEQWRAEMKTPVRTAPSVCGNTVLVQTLDNRLSARNVNTGAEIWHYEMSAEDTVLAGSATPACSKENNFVVAAFSNGEVTAFNLATGYPLWSVSVLNLQTFNATTAINAVKAAPVISGETVYALGHNDTLTAIDYRTGDKLWERRIGGTNMPWLAGNTLFITGNDHDLMAIDTASGDTLWQTPLMEDYSVKERNNVYTSGPIMVDSRLLITISDGTLYAYNPQNGALFEKTSLDGDLSGAPVVADGKVIVTTDDATVIVYE